MCNDIGSERLLSSDYGANVFCRIANTAFCVGGVIRPSFRMSLALSTVRI
jgi:hypothetical protein